MDPQEAYLVESSDADQDRSHQPVAIVTGAARIKQSRSACCSQARRIDVGFDAAALRSADRHWLRWAGWRSSVDVTDARDRSRHTIQFALRQRLTSRPSGIGGPTGPIWEYDLAAFRQVFDVNVVGVFLCCKTVVPLMRKNNYGRIVNIASIAGKNGTPTFAAYGASKAAVIALTKALGRELADTEILANAVCPSIADTDILQQHSPEKIKELVALVPKGRFVRTDEIAAMVAWLSSEECSFSTGQVFDITGGRSVY
jgi:3-oxoacyl-[acyl-carrier protein] reductase